MANAPKIGSIAWHYSKIEEKIAKKSKAGQAGAKARNEKYFKYKEGYGHNLTTKKKKPLPRYRSRIDYDFLKYIRLVFKWAIENNELNRPQLEFLLYLYGIGAFSRKQFDDYHKLIGLYSVKTLQWFMDEGWVTIWRTKSKESHMLYVVTQKGKMLCNLMHKYAAGIEEIPVTKSLNKMAGDEASRMNTYYINMIKRMNKDKAPKE